jgi:tripartite-type tricarboxylate transporter receptor subunit TctC
MKSIQRLIAGLMLLVGSGAALAQANYPDKPIRMLVGFAPAGVADICARVIAEKLAQFLGKPVVVENIGGAGGNVASERVAKAPPDGYTLYMAASSALVSNPLLYERVNFDPVKDFAPISQTCFAPNVLALNNDVPARTVADLTALARARPGQLSFASAGVGTTQHLAGELFKSIAKVEIQHVPYRGLAQAIPDLLAGRVSMIFGSISNVLPLARDGQLRVLAVTSLKRWPALPDVPTLDEQGFPGFDATVWFGLFAPAGTAAPIIARLHAETVRVVGLADVRNKFDEFGMAPISSTPAELAAAIQSEIPHWARVIKESGARATE